RSLHGLADPAAVILSESDMGAARADPDGPGLDAAVLALAWAGRATAVHQAWCTHQQVLPPPSASPGQRNVGGRRPFPPGRLGRNGGTFQGPERDRKT